METRRLRYFVVAAEEENLRRAAARLHIVQPALSKQIALLESELGCALFLRAKQRIHLTAAGRAYLDDARRILRDLELSKARAQQVANGQLGLLSIGFRETAARAPAVSRSIGAFRAAYPQVELRLNQWNSPAQCEAIRTGELDAGFIYLSSEHDQGLKRLLVARDRFYIALHRDNPLAQKKTLRLQDLTDERFIWLARSRHAYYSNTLLRDCMTKGLVPRIVQEVDSEATALNLVAVGMGVSFVVADNESSPLPDVVLKRVAELKEMLTLALVWNEKSVSPLVEKFVDVVRNNLVVGTSAHDRK